MAGRARELGPGTTFAKVFPKVAGRVRNAKVAPKVAGLAARAIFVSLAVLGILAGFDRFWPQVRGALSAERAVASAAGASEEKIAQTSNRSRLVAAQRRSVCVCHDLQA